jgi:hypothetical protein
MVISWRVESLGACRDAMEPVAMIGRSRIARDRPILLAEMSELVSGFDTARRAGLAG